MKFLKQVRNIIIYSLVVSFTVVNEVFAQTFLENAQGKLESAGQTAGGEEYTERGLGEIVGSAIKVVLQMVGLIFLVLMVYAGFLWMSSRGNREKIEKARDIMITAVVGLFIVLSAYAITFLVTGSL